MSAVVVYANVERGYVSFRASSPPTAEDIAHLAGIAALPGLARARWVVRPGTETRAPAREES